MYKPKPKIIIVMPAYNAEKTLRNTLQEIPKKFSDHIILVDDESHDKTVTLARQIGLTVIVHKHNLGYGGNQKTCYGKALKYKPNVVVMLHPDNQYDASKLNDLVQPILDGSYEIMLGSRIQTRNETLAGGMPAVKYYLNRLYSILENMILGVHLTDHFTGLRAYSRHALEIIPYQRFSNDFVFDQQFLITAVARNLRIGEIPIPARYMKEASSIGFIRGSKFLLETILVLFRYIYEKIP